MTLFKRFAAPHMARAGQPRKGSRVRAFSLIGLFLVLALAAVVGGSGPNMDTPRVHADVPQQQQPALSANFDWTMPDRFGLDEDGDGLTDYFTTVESVSPDAWRVNFDACGSDGQIISFDWSISGISIDGTDTRSVSSCSEFFYEFPIEGPFSVVLTTRDSQGNSASSSQTVMVQDWLIVGIGDSVGSGQGSPEISIPQSAWTEVIRRSELLKSGLEDFLLAERDLFDAEKVLNGYIEWGNGIKTKIQALNDARSHQADRCDSSKHSQVLVLGSSDNIACGNATAETARKSADLAASLTGDDGEVSDDDVGTVDDLDSLVGALGAIEAEAIAFVAENFIDFKAIESEVLAAFADAISFAETLNAQWQDEHCRRSANSAQAQAAKILEQEDPRTSVTFVHLACAGADIQNGLIDEQAVPGIGDVPPFRKIATVGVMIRFYLQTFDSYFLQNGPFIIEFSDYIQEYRLFLEDYDSQLNLARGGGAGEQVEPVAVARPSQIAQAARLTNGREVDALLVSSGAGEGNLYEIIVTCALMINCDDPAGFLDQNGYPGINYVPAPPAPPAPAPYPKITVPDVDRPGHFLHEEGSARINSSLDDLQSSLLQLMPELESEDVYITEYPDVTKNSEGYCQEGVLFGIIGYSASEAEWLDLNVEQSLNQALANAADRHNWNMVGGVYDDSVGQGYCEPDGWTTRLSQSFAVQGDILGAYHPNENGHANNGARLADSLAANLYSSGDMTQPRAPKLNLEPLPLLFYQYELDVRTVGSGSGKVIAAAAGIDCGTVCGGLYNPTVEINLGFSPASDSKFVGWLGDCTGLGGCTVTMDDDRLVSAVFQLKDYSLPIQISGTGAGRIISSPSGISCDVDCTGSFVAGTSVTLTADAGPGSDFFGWRGACSGTNPCALSMDFTQSVEAIFTTSNRVVPTDFPSGRTPVNVLFSQVNQPGFTFLLIIPVGPISSPEGFDLGEPRELYQLGTLTEFTGPATVCLEYDGTTFNDPSTLRLFHNTGGAAWTDTTSFNYAPGSVICGSVDELPAAGTSVFGVFEKIQSLPAPTNVFNGVSPGAAVDSASSIVSGSTVAGDVVGFSGESVVVGIEGIAVEILVSDGTSIHEPPNINVGLATVSLGRRVVVTADQDFLDASGSLVDATFTAESIVIIPEQVTRNHQRAVVKDKESAGVTVIDQDGKESKLPTSGDSKVSRGDNVVLVVQKFGRGGLASRTTGLFSANVVDERLKRFADNASDPLKTARLRLLRSDRDTVEEQRLSKTATNLSGGLRTLIGDKVETLRDKRSRATDSSKELLSCAQRVLGDSGVSYGDLPADQQARLKGECLADNISPEVKITSPEEGAVVATASTITIAAEAEDNVGITSVAFTADGAPLGTDSEAPYTATFNVPMATETGSITVEAIATDEAGNSASSSVTVQVFSDPPPSVTITSPVSGSGSSEDAEVEAEGETEAPDPVQPSQPQGVTINEGQTITISANATDNVSVVSVAFSVNGQTQGTVTSPPYNIQYSVPNTPAATAPLPLEITATATDNVGNIASDTVIVDVQRSSAPTVRIVVPTPSEKVTEGDTIGVTVETNDDSEIASVLFSVGGIQSTDSIAPFTTQYSVPAGPATATSPSNALPHVFVGTITLGGSPAPDGAVVVAYVAAPKTSELTIEATAFNKSGQSGKSSVTLDVFGARIAAGEATVAGGSFTVTAVQPNGQSFNGKTVTFTVDGIDAAETGKWKAGGADIVDLAAN